MTCRHENADPDPRWLNLGDAEVSAIVEQFRCIDCGAWLSLGPSNDRPAAVRVEIRAAEFIACQETALAVIKAGGYDTCRCGDNRRRIRPAELELLARLLAKEVNRHPR